MHKYVIITYYCFILIHFFKKDVNECDEGKSNCDVDADCIDTVGSFYCNCTTGYFGDGVTCNSMSF